MIKIFTTPTCAYCKVTKEFLKRKQVEYTEIPAQGEEYERLASLFGFTVPLVYNDQTQEGMVGYAPQRLVQIISTEA